MNNTPALGGHRMVLAIIELADTQTADLAQEYEATVIMPGMPWEMLDHARQVLWEALVRRAQRGEITIRGVLDAVAGAVTISPDVLRGSKPDFLADTLQAAGVTFHAVGISEAGGSPASPSAIPPRQSSSGLNYNTTDRPLLDEMQTLIDKGKATGIQDAARAVALRAQGKGSEDSKVKRLMEKFSRGQSGQS